MKTIFLSVILSLFFTFIIHFLLKYYYYFKNKNDKYKYNSLKKHVNIFKKLDQSDLSDEELMKLLYDYSMNVDNYLAGVKNIQKIKKKCNSSKVKTVADYASLVLAERFKNKYKM